MTEMRQNIVQLENTVQALQTVPEQWYTEQWHTVQPEQGTS